MSREASEEKATLNVGMVAGKGGEQVGMMLINNIDVLRMLRAVYRDVWVARNALGGSKELPNASIHKQVVTVSSCMVSCQEGQHRCDFCFE